MCDRFEGGGAFLGRATPIREQPRKGPSWIGFRSSSIFQIKSLKYCFALSQCFREKPFSYGCWLTFSVLARLKYCTFHYLNQVMRKMRNISGEKLYSLTLTKTNNVIPEADLATLSILFEKIFNSFRISSQGALSWMFDRTLTRSTISDVWQDTDYTCAFDTAQSFAPRCLYPICEQPWIGLILIWLSTFFQSKICAFLF